MLIVDMPMPIVCADCPICICINGRKPAYCKAVLVDDDNIVDGTMWKETDPNSIPDWCPIKGELVRCGECRYKFEKETFDGLVKCVLHNAFYDADYYCGYGERKDGEHEIPKNR